MSTPSALKSVAAPIADLKPRTLILSNAGVVPLGFVAQGTGTVVVKWSSPLDPDNPNESLPVVNGGQYPGQIDTVVSSDVALLFYFGDPSAGNAHLGFPSIAPEVVQAFASLGVWSTHDVINVPVEPADALQLPSAACSEIKMVAHTSNTKPIYIGDVLVNSTDTPPTNAGYGEILEKITDASEFYVVAAFAGQKLQYQTR